MEGKSKKQIIKTITKVLLHLILILCICFYMFLTFAFGPYDDHYISQKVISPYRFEMSINACLVGGVFNAFVAWLSFKKAKVFSVIYMVLGSICFARLAFLLFLLYKQV